MAHRVPDDAHCYGWEQMTVDGHPVCFNQRDSRAPMDDGDSLEYHVNIGVENAEELLWPCRFRISPPG